MKVIRKRILIILPAILILAGYGFKSNFFEIAKQIEIYSAVFKQLDMYYIDEINAGELNRKAMKKMLSSLDPYTVFYDEQGIEDVRIRRSGEYGGIGAYTRTRGKRLFILEPYKDAPAAKAGLKAGDEILAIDGIPVSESDGDNAGSLLRGLPGTKVELEILRRGEKMKIIVERAKIDVHPVPYYDMVNENTGYISLVKFNEKTSRELLKAYRDLKNRGMEKLILDLRGNPGGLLSQAISVVNMFVPKGKVVVNTKAKVKKWSKTYKTNSEPLDTEIPLAVLINGRSASASEIVSGALQDYDRAVIMGERSFGKGLVQRYRNLPYGTQMKLTISKYYIPSGRCIQELDYSHKDKDGNIPKYSEGKVNTFHTANGRKVIEGGGITPDIALKETQTLDITRQLFKSDALFDFVTGYYYDHPGTIEPENFVLNDEVFDLFMQYLIEHPEKYQTPTEKKIKTEIEKSQKEGFGEEIQATYKNFSTELAKIKTRQLQADKEYIMSYLTEEIVKRYAYREGAYRQKVHHDPWIQQAANLLNDEKKYRKILK